jgi:hypothetical protein
MEDFRFKRDEIVDFDSGYIELKLYFWKDDRINRGI